VSQVPQFCLGMAVAGLVSRDMDVVGAAVEEGVVVVVSNIILMDGRLGRGRRRSRRWGFRRGRMRAIAL